MDTADFYALWSKEAIVVVTTKLYGQLFFSMERSEHEG